MDDLSTTYFFVKCIYNTDSGCKKLNSSWKCIDIFKEGMGGRFISGCSLIEVDWITYLTNKKYLLEVLDERSSRR